MYKLGFSALYCIQQVCHLSEPSAATFFKHRSRYQFLYLWSKIFFSCIWGCLPSEESSTIIISGLHSEVSSRTLPQPWAKETPERAASKGVLHHHSEKDPLPFNLTAPAPVQLPLTLPWMPKVTSSLPGRIIWLPGYSRTTPPYTFFHTHASPTGFLLHSSGLRKYSVMLHHFQNNPQLPREH